MSTAPAYFRFLWIREPRQQLAQLLRGLADKLDTDGPIDLDAEFEAGYRIGHRAGTRDGQAAQA